MSNIFNKNNTVMLCHQLFQINQKFDALYFWRLLNEIYESKRVSLQLIA